MLANLAATAEETALVDTTRREVLSWQKVLSTSHAQWGVTMPTSAKTLTIRLPLDLYQAISAVAKQRHISFKALVQESLATILRDEEDARLYEAFGQLGADAEEADVEFATAAQWAVVSCCTCTEVPRPSHLPPVAPRTCTGLVHFPKRGLIIGQDTVRTEREAHGQTTQVQHNDNFWHAR